MSTPRSNNVSSDIASDVEDSKLNETIAFITFSMLVQHMLMGAQHMLLVAQHMLMGAQYMLLVKSAYADRCAAYAVGCAAYAESSAACVRQCKIKAISPSN